MKKKKLVKLALRHPELYTQAELAYFRLWLLERKRLKFTKRNGFYTDCKQAAEK
jgi:hypothetical protein